MPPAQLACMLIFALVLFTTFVILPWNAVYQRRIRQGKPLLEQWSIKTSRLDVLDVLLTFFVYFGIQVIAVVFIVENPDPDDSPSQFLHLSPFNSAAGLTTLLTLAIVIPILFFRRGDLRDFRLRTDRYTELCMIGLIAALLLVPATMTLNALVSILVTPYSHPVIETLLAEASVTTLVYTAITVVIAAPLVEEFVFRGVILTFLQRAFSGRWSTQNIFYCPADAQPDVSPVRQDNFQLHGANLLTSLLFAGLHFGQGAAYIPLFFLSLGIGYVANKTGSILPCILIHMTLNGISSIPLIFLVLNQT